MVSTVKREGGGIMVCGCMTASREDNAVVINGIMDPLYCIHILKENLPASAENLGIEDDCQFYQDNDPKHSAQITRRWLLYKCPKVIKTPIQSPTPLSTCGAYWKKILREYHFSNKPKMEILREEWSKIDQEAKENLVKSMPQGSR
ncbi:transposable element Tcb1 transposase [Trichonephila clavipes]|nr:transposable element Tcb1 transposase [Trichonephila clavipes]